MALQRACNAVAARACRNGTGRPGSMGSSETPTRRESAMTAMTAMSITRTTTDPMPGRRSGAASTGGIAARLERWSADRRHRRNLLEQDRWSRRDRTDRYLDRPDETYRRRALAAFV